MKRFYLLFALLTFALTAFGDTYNNFTGYSDYWNPLGNPNTATYAKHLVRPPMARIS